MNDNRTNTDMNIEDYENLAVQKSKLAKRAAIGAAAVVGGAAIAGGTAYAASQGGDTPLILDEPLTADEMAVGAEVGDEFQPTPEPETQYVYVERPAAQPEPEPEPEMTVTWDETTNIYVDDEKVGSIEEGTVDGHKFMMMDYDGDNHADILAIDVNDNGQFEEDEIIRYTPEDHVHMGHETTHTTDKYFSGDDFIEPQPNPYDPDPEPYPYDNYQREPIHNNFEDEKTGEEYHGDYAENNPDYNPRADIDYGDSNQYLAENEGYDENDGYYNAGSNYAYDVNEGESGDFLYTEENNYTAEIDEPNVDPSYDMADNDMESGDSFDSMMSSDEFLG